MQTDEKHDMAFVLPTESRNTPSSEGNNSLKERTISSNGIVPAPENGLSEESTAPALKGFGRADPAQVHLHQQAGINRIEAFHRTFGRNSIVSWMLYASLLLTSMAYVFDQSSTFKYLTFATSYFEASEYIGTISTAQSIITAVSKPFIAKIADTFSRQMAYMVTLVCYVLGYIVIAASPNGVALCVGRVITASGQAGLSLITQLIIADLTPLEWRGFTTSMTNFCYLFLPWISATMVGNLCPTQATNNHEPCWRWGFGMFTIITPVCVMPAIATLTYADIKAKQAGEVGAGMSKFALERAQQEGTFAIKRFTVKDRFHQLYRLLVSIDAVGLILLGFAFSLIFLPFSLNKKAGGWGNPSMIAMIVCGFVILLIFFGWEIWLAPEPIVNRRIWGNKTFVMCATIDVFYMFSGFVRSTYWDEWVYVIKPWSNSTWSYFTQTQTVGLTFFGLCVGLCIRFTHRYKVLQLSGLCIRIIGMGITYYAVGDNASDVALAFTQILIALGGACSVVGCRVASQASVPHQDLAMVIANLSLWSKLGSSVGSAVGSAIYTGRYEKELAKTGLPLEIQKAALGSYSQAHALPWGSEERIKVMKAFDDTQRPTFLAALVISVVPLLCGLYMPNFYLGKAQNAIDNTGNDGRVRNDPEGDINAEELRQAKEVRQPFWKRLWQGHAI